MFNHVIDLVSDTVTRPSAAMREVMSQAEVGDDGRGDDPTVNALQDRAARLFNKEAALFLASGTMANQIAIKAYTQPGDEVIADADCHTYRSGMAAVAMISGVQLVLLPSERGVFTREAVEGALRPKGGLVPRSALIMVENTHNFGGGQVFPLEQLEELRALSLEQGIPLIIDGARIFNAVVAAGVTPQEWGGQCDALSFCISKGLGCPVGSVLVGTADFIERARRYRKALGGVWRQAGILAAAGLYALDHNVDCLAEDHANAQRFAEFIAGVPGVRNLYDTTPTNIIYFDVAETGLSAQEVSIRLRERGVAISAASPTLLRAVTHLDVSREDVDRATQALAEAVT